MSIAVRQAVQASNSLSAQTSLAAPAVTVLAGSYIFVIATIRGGGTFSVPTDGTNTYTQISSTVIGNGVRIGSFVAGPVSAGTYTVTSNFTSTTYPTIAVAEITGSTGLDTAGTDYSTNYQAASGTGTGVVTSGNCTPSTAGLIIGATLDTQISQVMSADTTDGYTDLFPAAPFWRFSGGTNKGAMEYMLYSSTAPLPALFNVATSTQTLTAAAIFAATGAPLSPYMDYQTQPRLAQ